MPNWNRERGRDAGDRMRGLADRAGDALRRGMDRLRGEDDEPRGYRGSWGGEYGRWGGSRYGRGDMGDRHPLSYRGDHPGYRGGHDPYHGEESGWGSVHYDRDFGYGAFGSLRDRGFEDRPYNEPGIHRFRPDQHASREFEGYDRDMRGGWHGSHWERGGRGGFERERDDRVRGMTPGWRGRRGGRDAYRGYGRGIGNDPSYGPDDFRGFDDRYDREFRDRDWF